MLLYLSLLHLNEILLELGDTTIAHNSTLLRISRLRLASLLVIIDFDEKWIKLRHIFVLTKELFIVRSLFLLGLFTTCFLSS